MLNHRDFFAVDCGRLLAVTSHHNRIIQEPVHLEANEDGRLAHPQVTDQHDFVLFVSHVFLTESLRSGHMD